MKESCSFQFQPYIPPVFRYLERRFVDDFFSKGELQLSTFLKCRKHPDEQRCDIDEGCGTIEYNINGTPARTEMQVGLDSYMLCTSLMCADQLFVDFKCDSCIKIKDPLSFADIVARKLHEVNKVLFGPCQYMPNRIIDRRDAIEPHCQNDQDYQTLFQNKVVKGIPHVQFRKHNDFCNQREYRFLWAIENAIRLEEPKVIEVPEALQLCSRRDRL